MKRQFFLSLLKGEGLTYDNYLMRKVKLNRLTYGKSLKGKYFKI